MKNIKKYVGLLAGTLAVTTVVYGGRGGKSSQETEKHIEKRPRLSPTNRQQRQENTMSAFRPSQSDLYTIISYESAIQTAPTSIKESEQQKTSIQAGRQNVKHIMKISQPPRYALKTFTFKDPFSYQQLPKTKSTLSILQEKGFTVSTEKYISPFYALQKYLNENSCENLKEELQQLYQGPENKSLNAFRKISKYLNNPIILFCDLNTFKVRVFHKGKEIRQDSDQKVELFLNEEMTCSEYRNAIIIYGYQSYHIVTPPNEQ